MTLVLLDTFPDSNGTDPTSRAPATGPQPTSGVGAWTVQSAKVVPEAGLNANGYFKYDVDSGDGVVTFDASLTNDSFLYTGAVIRWSDANNFWIADVRREAGNTKLVFTKMEGGVQSTFDTLDTGEVLSTTEEITITLDGSSMTISCGGHDLEVTSSFNATADKVGPWAYTGFGNPQIPIDNFEFDIAATTVPSFTGTATLVDALHATFTFDPNGSTCAANPDQFAITGQAATAGETIADVEVETGTSGPLTGTITLTNGVPPGASLGFTVGTGALSSTGGNSASGTLTTTNDNETPEDITAKVTFNVTGAHSATVEFNDAGTMISPYLDIADVILVPTDLDDLDDAEGVDFRIEINGEVAAEANTWTFHSAASDGTSIRKKLQPALELHHWLGGW